MSIEGMAFIVPNAPRCGNGDPCAGTVTTSSAAATGLATAEGTFTGVSAGAGGTGITNATAQALYDAVPLRNAYTGLCGECAAISNALNAGAKVEGATMATVRIASEKIMEACPACRFVADKLGINLVPKP